ncbi:MAG: glycine--tRNA ligase subunit beta [Nevskiaceae bacterium]|nr:MAG: glycine--tRNA ligase subunit beta [Nevskiaceae bacterium]TBR75015.1 MAG: glycine--tRNA ligase subunit beta [Nevskiaceae bacterium]
MPSAPLFIEIGTEDLPARYAVSLADALLEGLSQGLKQRGIGFGAAQRFATPRRVAVHIADVESAQPEQRVHRDGPTLAIAIKDGVPTRAGLGFAKSCGVEFTALAHKDGKLHFEARTPGARMPDLIPAIFAEALARMDTLVPKRMHWDGSTETFVRPVRWLVALYAGAVVPLQHFGLDAGCTTYGHRFHAPGPIELGDGTHYEDRLRSAHVWADPDTRRVEIRHQIEAAATQIGGTARISTALLNEVTSLVEWPVVITGQIEERFMELPPEVIVATVETNQRYFTVFDARGQLLPAFITISNIESKDPAQVVAGNERVVRPRLADGLFFWRQDLRQPLAAYGAKLAHITFQKKLGSLSDKVARTAALAQRLAPHMGADASAAHRAATLCKNDLTTQMVGEFPELQGVMGGYYAARGAEPAAVAGAIRDHYLPNQQGGTLPASAEGRAVALADKLDTLAGYFAIGEKPTASKDPFALRRAALGVVRILVEGGHDLDLREWLAAALQAQPAGDRSDAVAVELLAFVQERQRAWSIGRSIDGRTVEANHYEAVAQLGLSRPLDIERRLAALTIFMATPAAASLAAADKRARNILRQAHHTATDVDRNHLQHPAGEALVTALDATRAELAPLRAAADYTAMLTRLATLRPPVDAFFEHVRVMDDAANVRHARLGVLAQLDALCREVADLSQLPG